MPALVAENITTTHSIRICTQHSQKKKTTGSDVLIDLLFDPDPMFAAQIGYKKCPVPIADLSMSL